MLAQGWIADPWHHVKDASLGEDACKVRSGYAPGNLTALRATALVLLARLGQNTLPDAIRWVSYETFTHLPDVIVLPDQHGHHRSPRMEQS